MTAQSVDTIVYKGFDPIYRAFRDDVVKFLRDQRTNPAMQHWTISTEIMGGNHTTLTVYEYQQLFDAPKTHHIAP